MSSKLKIDLVSDVVCPWCVIGYKRLEQAIKELGVSDKIEIEWHPFELNPNMAAEGENLREHLANKYGTTLEDSIRARDNLTHLGKELGFTFDYFDDMRMYNTNKAHLLLQYAKEFGKQTELKLALFSAFFSERKDVSDKEVLADAAEKVGLNVKEALEYLDKTEAQSALELEQMRWRNLGINSVPTVVFNMTSALTGAQPVDVYKQVVAELLDEQSL
ncbi:DsbA family oxidoreductase [Vibrio hannami]|uniref:DsbA family oxidoreductase n=1 Tax=Vibrio hannami TaxID=2717094 RepID=UPI0024108388|nr:DsbA family oxidoreductase [Vibrio hannami]MDG3084820.1 DsbA family oxidoreductase [Vibrio hannami]